MACVGDNVAADGVDCICEELVGLRHDLVSYNCHGVESSGEPYQPVHVIVQTLLSFCQHLSSQVLASEMGRYRVDYYHSYVIVLDNLIRFFQEKHLVI